MSFKIEFLIELLQKEKKIYTYIFNYALSKFQSSEKLNNPTSSYI